MAKNGNSSLDRAKKQKGAYMTILRVRIISAIQTSRSR